MRELDLAVCIEAYERKRTSEAEIRGRAVDSVEGAKAQIEACRYGIFVGKKSTPTWLGWTRNPKP